MALVKIRKLLILRSSDRHFRPILAPKSRFSAACKARRYCISGVGRFWSRSKAARSRPA
jgi:hypothetical protein